MAPSYKLYYFDNRGRAEAIRQLLKLAKVPFEDIRLDHETFAATYKNDTPFGQLPVLEVDGVKIAQSQAILRYIANTHGFVGKTPLENAKIDQLAEVIHDASADPALHQWVLVVLGFKPVPDKSDFFKLEARPALDKHAGLYEKWLVEHVRPSFILEDVTWVDVLAAEFFTKFVEYGEEDALDAYPHIQALIARVHNLPEIRKHIQERKPTTY